MLVPSGRIKIFTHQIFRNHFQIVQGIVRRVPILVPDTVSGQYRAMILFPHIVMHQYALFVYCAAQMSTFCKREFYIIQDLQSFHFLRAKLISAAAEHIINRLAALPVNLPNFFKRFRQQVHGVHRRNYVIVFALAMLVIQDFIF